MRAYGKKGPLSTKRERTEIFHEISNHTFVGRWEPVVFEFCRCDPSRLAALDRFWIAGNNPTKYEVEVDASVGIVVPLFTQPTECLDRDVDLLQTLSYGAGLHCLSPLDLTPREFPAMPQGGGLKTSGDEKPSISFNHSGNRFNLFFHVPVQRYDLFVQPPTKFFTQVQWRCVYKGNASVPPSLRTLRNSSLN